MSFSRLSRTARLLLAVVLLGTIAGGLSTPAGATISFSVSTGLVDLTGTPGSTGSQELLIRNDGDESLELRIAIEPTPSVSSDRSAVAWLSLETDALTIAPGDGASLRVQITIPDDVESGGYYARVTLTSATDEAADNVTAVAGQLAVGFMITVDGRGEIEQSAAIGRFAAVLEQDGRIGFRVELINNGNVHLINPSGIIEVVDDAGASYGNLPIPETIPLLPGNTSVMSTQGSLPMTAGAAYRAEAGISYSGLETPLTASTDFMIEPLLEAGNITICENLDRGPTLTVELANSGTIGLQPVVFMQVSTADGTSLGSAPVATGQLLWPDEERVLSIDFPERLPSGEYRLLTTVSFDPLGEPIVLDTPFQIGGIDGDPVPFCTSS